MTIIVWDGTTLAADRCSWSGGMRRKVRKIFKVTASDKSMYLVGFAGDGCFSMAVLGWMQGKLDKPSAADFNYDVSHQCALVIDQKKRAWQLGASLVYTPCRENVFCIGAGQEVAWGALEAGASAKRAVEIVAKRSDYSAFGVDCLRFK